MSSKTTKTTKVSKNTEPTNAENPQQVDLADQMATYDLDNAEAVSDALIAQLAAYDLQNPDSTKANATYWRSMASNPATIKQAASAAMVVSGGNKAIAATAAMAKKREMWGTCNRDGCTHPVGLFGSKCTCGSYRMDLCE